jgi:hypothetical protein
LTKEIEHVTVSTQEFESDEFRAPSKFYIRDAMDNFIFVKVRNRGDAQDWIDVEYGTIQGKSKYKIRTVIKAAIR